MEELYYFPGKTIFGLKVVGRNIFAFLQANKKVYTTFQKLSGLNR